VGISRGDAHLIGIKDKSSDVTMSLAFDDADSVWCRDTSNNDISLLFKFDYQWEAQRVVAAQHNLEKLSNVNAMKMNKRTHQQPASYQEQQ